MITYYQKLLISCLFIFVTGIGFLVTDLMNTVTLNEQRIYLSQIAKIQSESIERRLGQSLLAAKVLGLEVQQNDGDISNFDEYAETVLRSIRGVSNLQLAPKGVITNIYPLLGNERAIGHSILLNDRRRYEALLARKDRKLTLTSPFELIQGGLAVIGRYPVFIWKGDKEVFWGFSSALIYLEELLNSTELALLENRGYHYQLSYRDRDSNKKHIFASSVDEVQGLQHNIVVKVPNDEWLLTLSPRHSETYWLYIIGFSCSLFIAALAAFILSFILRQPNKLREVVKQKTMELQSLAYHDFLTGLDNRYFLTEKLKHAIRMAHGEHTITALIYLDLDNFKRINDSLGHDVGDQMLQLISKRLVNVVDQSAIVARIGGDEFAILVSDLASLQALEALICKVQQTIEKPIRLQNKKFKSSASIGVVKVATDGNNPRALLQNADIAMYAAKKSGKGQYRLFDQQLQIAAIEKIKLEDGLAEAIKKDQFVLNYQPIIKFEDNSVCHYEALIRWQHPELGMVYPDKFIPLLEETGMIVNIGYIVLRKACELIKQRGLDSSKCNTIAINLSPIQFKDEHLLADIAEIVTEVGVDPQFLEIEITESSLMDDLPQTIATLTALRDMGIKISIDDFGTGYSSLAQLKTLPFDKLKIDRKFILDIEDNPEDQEILKAISSMAAALKLDVVVEGIETEKQLMMVKEYGCGFGQGYYFSKPVAESLLD